MKKPEHVQAYIVLLGGMVAVIGCAASRAPEAERPRGTSTKVSADLAESEGRNLLSALDGIGSKGDTPRVGYGPSHEVTSVWLNTSFATDKNIRLLTGYPGLADLRISCPTTPISADCIGRLCALKHLRRIELRGAVEHVTTEYCSALANIRSLEIIVIRDSEIENDALLPFQTLPNLKTLAIHGTAQEFTDLNMPAVARLRHIEDLDLSQTGVTDGSLDLVAVLPMLRRLRVQQTQVTEDGVRKSGLLGRVIVEGAKRLTPSDAVSGPAYLPLRGRMWCNPP